MIRKLDRDEKIILFLLGVLILLGGASVYFCLRPNILSRPNHFFLIDWLAISIVLAAYSATLMKIEEAKSWAIYLNLFFLVFIMTILAIKFGVGFAFLGFLLFSISGWITEKV